MNKLTICLLWIGCFGCGVDNSEAARALNDVGFTNITITDSGIASSWHGCGQDDGVWYEATATNPVGKNVNMVVCCGGFGSYKGCTVRSR